MTGIVLLVVAAVAAGVMGYAIQRGATCIVAALDEVVAKRGARRLLALAEAAAIVTGGLAIASVAGLLQMAPAHFQVTGWTVLGGALLGLGAFVAKGCVFGSIARLGSGEWAYLAVPPGFFLGCLVGLTALSNMAPAPVVLPSLVLASASFLLLPFGAFFAWRVWAVIAAARERRLAAHVWSPHVATSIIGLAFVVLLLVAGPWSYNEALADAAAGRASMTGQRLLLFLSLFGGAMLGGWTAGKLSFVTPTRASVLRCLGGGALMGAGGVLVPGSNDGLILVGLPLLLPHALVALASMSLTIVAALSVQKSAVMASTRKLA